MFLQLSFFVVSTIVMISCSILIQESPYSVLQVIWLSLIHVSRVPRNSGESEREWEGTIGGGRERE